jgi:hypothetical protein
VLITYLGNDLFDNQLPFPLQADNAKPFFELAGSPNCIARPEKLSR